MATDPRFAVKFRRYLESEIRISAQGEKRNG